jgi:hypothetical protein
MFENCQREGCQYKSPEELFRASIALDDDGCKTIRTVTVTAESSDCEQFTCDMTSISSWELLSLLFNENDDGCMALRISETS